MLTSRYQCHHLGPFSVKENLDYFANFTRDYVSFHDHSNEVKTEEWSLEMKRQSGIHMQAHYLLLGSNKKGKLQGLQSK